MYSSCSDSEDEPDTLSSLIQKVRNGTENSANMDSALCSNFELIKRFELTSVLQGHMGCVNTIEWNVDGNLLVSGSDDRQLKVWNRNGQELTSFESGHAGNIFSAKFMNNCNDSKVISGAADGTVIVNQWRSNESGISNTICRWNCSKRVKQVVLDHTCDDCFFSCGEDGKLIGYDMRSRESTLLVRAEESGQIKALASCPARPMFLAVGFAYNGVKMYDLRNMNKPFLSCSTSYSTIFHHSVTTSPTFVEFNRAGTEIVVNMHNDGVYIFDVTQSQGADPRFPERMEHIRTKQDFENEVEPSTCMHNHPLYFADEFKIADEYFQIKSYTKALSLYSRCISFAEKHWTKAPMSIEMKAELAMLYQLRGQAYQKREYKCDRMEAARDFVRSLELFPMNKEATIGVIKALEDFKQRHKSDQWKKMLNERFGGENIIPESSSKIKTRVWSVLTMRSIRDYSQRFVGARNFRTDIKQARFYGGKDEYVLSGSDCGNLFIFERSTGNVVKLLKADDHVLNCVVPHPYEPLIATSGIEKFVRFWTPWMVGDKEFASTRAPETPLVWLKRDVSDSIDDVVAESLTFERRVTPMDFIRFASLMEDRGQFQADCRPS